MTNMGLVREGWKISNFPELLEARRDDDCQDWNGDRKVGDQNALGTFSINIGIKLVGIIPKDGQVEMGGRYHLLYMHV